MKQQHKVRDRQTALSALLQQAVQLHAQRRYVEAEPYYKSILKTDPDHFEARQLLGDLRLRQGRYDDAVKLLRQALVLNNKVPQVHINLANALASLSRFDDAIAVLDRALTIDPASHKARFDRALLVLRGGDLAAGWADYEARLALPGAPQTPGLVCPRWTGEPIAGKRIVVHHEQGIGDTIQFCRYLPLLAALGAEVTFLVPSILHQILQPIGASVRLANQVPQEPFDFQCALLSLPGLFATTLETVPTGVPYLAAQPALVETWQRQLGGQGFKVGIAWQGNPADKVDFGRSIPLRQFQPLAAIPGVRLVSLQKTHGLEQLAGLPPSMRVETLGSDFDSGPNAFVDTAAVMANLDLIVTSDTSIAHLAGALGRPVWLVLKQVPDWRWLLARPDCPWYPTMRLYRQSQYGDWTSVFARLAADLRGRLPPGMQTGGH